MGKVWTMKKRMYVGNLNYAVTEKELNDLFGEFGEVTYAKVITRPDGRSKGFGFVEMAEEDQAKDAMEKLNQSSFMERTIIVNEAKERENRPPRMNNNRGSYGDDSGGKGDDLNYKLRQLRRKFK
jgi:RNA recognition motif-containing protein